MSESNNSSKFYGLSLVIHTLLVALVIYLNFPAIKQKFQPEPVAIELETVGPKEELAATTAPVDASTNQPVTAPATAIATTTPTVTDAKKSEIAKETKVEKVAKKPASVMSAKKPAPKTPENKAKLKIEEFKEELKDTEKLSETSITQPSATAATNAPAVTPKPAIIETPITETRIEDASIPLPEIVEKSEPTSTQAATATLPATTATPVTSAAIVSQVERSSSLQQQARTELSQQSPARIEMPSAEEIREVVDLRQRPGNPLPRYSDLERLRRHEGEVVYLAYVTPEGRLTNFILTQSSGYSNLDQKTLNALKAWRFYPGQEGWVEIPQVWVLTGEAEELPSQLRR